MAARKINLHYRQLTGNIQSNKQIDEIAFESRLEKDALLLAEFRYRYLFTGFIFLVF